MKGELLDIKIMEECLLKGHGYLLEASNRLQVQQALSPPTHSRRPAVQTVLATTDTVLGLTDPKGTAISSKSLHPISQKPSGFLYTVSVLAGHLPSIPSLTHLTITYRSDV